MSDLCSVIHILCFFFSLQLLKESNNGPRIHLHFSNLVMNRGLSCHISEGYRLCGNWNMWQKKGEEHFPLNTSDLQSEAKTKQGSLLAALVSLNHERLPIVWEKVGSGAVCSALSDSNGDATRSSSRPRNVTTSGLPQPENGRVEGNGLLHGQGLCEGQSALVRCG